jgi:hypothetical protein
MNPQEKDNESFEIQERHPVFQVTRLSKYLAMILFIMMPFVGGYIGYTYAPEKVIEVEKIITQKEESEKTVSDMEVECLSNDTFFIVAPIMGEPLDSIIIKRKQNYQSDIECVYEIKESDTVIEREWGTTVLADNIDDNRLYISNGAGAIRSMKVYDLESNTFVLEDTISPGGIDPWLDSVKYWSPADKRMTSDDCSEMYIGMMGKGLDEYVEYNFKTQRRIIIGEKCAVREQK